MNERIKELAFQSAGGLLRFDERGFMLYEDEVEKFAELVRADEREACAKLAEEMERIRFDSVGDPRIKVFESQIAKAIRARGDASDIPAERVDETPKCKDDPRAPHGFDRNASHSADRYVCECEGWEPPKEWVGLTQEEFLQCAQIAERGNCFLAITFAQQTLKEKNAKSLQKENLQKGKKA